MDRRLAPVPDRRGVDREDASSPAPGDRMAFGLVAVSVWVQDARGIYIALALILVIVVHVLGGWRADGENFVSPLIRMRRRDGDVRRLRRPETGSGNLSRPLGSAL